MSNDIGLIIKEFKPALKFLAVFVLVYVLGNVIYGIWIEDWKPMPDPMTDETTMQTVYLLRFFSEPVLFEASSTEPLVFLLLPDHIVLRVYEGCNGINVMIVFVAFMVAFGGHWKRKSIFILIGLVVIHGFNLLRIALLYYMAEYRPMLFYYFHKYLFTMALYAVVFVLWYIWIRQSGIKKRNFAPAEKQME